MFIWLIFRLSLSVPGLIVSRVALLSFIKANGVVWCANKSSWGELKTKDNSRSPHFLSTDHKFALMFSTSAHDTCEEEEREKPTRRLKSSSSGCGYGAASATRYRLPIYIHLRDAMGKENSFSPWSYRCRRSSTGDSSVEKWHSLDVDTWHHQTTSRWLARSRHTKPVSTEWWKHNLHEFKYQIWATQVLGDVFSIKRNFIRSLVNCHRSSRLPSSSSSPQIEF